MSRAPGSIDDRKKQAVLDATLQLCIDHGDRFSISQVARRAGVSRQTIYNQFGDRGGLLRAFAESTRLPCPACPPLNGRLEPELAAYAERLLRWRHDVRRVAASGLERGGHADRQAESACWPDGVDTAASILSERLEQAAPRGQSRAVEPVLAAKLFLDLVLGAARRPRPPELRAGPSEDEIARRADAAARLFVGGYVPAGSAPTLRRAPARAQRSGAPRAFTPEETSP